MTQAAFAPAQAHVAVQTGAGVAQGATPQVAAANASPQQASMTVATAAGTGPSDIAFASASVKLGQTKGNTPAQGISLTATQQQEVTRQKVTTATAKVADSNPQQANVHVVAKYSPTISREQRFKRPITNNPFRGVQMTVSANDTDPLASALATLLAGAALTGTDSPVNWQPGTAPWSTDLFQALLQAAKNKAALVKSAVARKMDGLFPNAPQWLKDLAHVFADVKGTVAKLTAQSELTGKTPDSAYDEAYAAAFIQFMAMHLITASLGE